MERDPQQQASRRDVLAGSGLAGIAATVPAGALAALTAAAAPGVVDVQAGGIAPTIFPYLQDLQTAVDQLGETWHPEDPAYRADFYRQIMMNLSWAYFAFFFADGEHPDWAPLWNPVYTDQPNPDDIYLYSPIRGDLRYRISGDRGTCALITMNVQKGWVGLVDKRLEQVQHAHAIDIDQNSLTVGPNNELDIILSASKPPGYTGNWIQVAPDVDTVVLRYVMIDWAKERDPHLTIECLDKVPSKRRLSPEETLRRIQEMARLPARYNAEFLGEQNEYKARVGVNKFIQVQYPGGGLSKQIYWPAIYELDDGEALIIETDMPKVTPYWNMQMNDPYFNAVEIVYRFSSINASTAYISPDGKLRAVIALEDPGVPNWLDPGEYKTGTTYGRWYGCDSAPLPTITRLPLADLRRHLPPDTPTVTPDERAEALRTRVLAAQRRRRW